MPKRPKPPAPVIHLHLTIVIQKEPPDAAGGAVLGEPVHPCPDCGGMWIGSERKGFKRHTGSFLQAGEQWMPLNRPISRFLNVRPFSGAASVGAAGVVSRAKNTHGFVVGKRDGLVRKFPKDKKRR